MRVDSTSPPDVSVVVPAKDEVESLDQLVREIRDALAEIKNEDGEPLRWEVVIVDDGSTDGSWDEIRRLSVADPRVSGLRFRRNLGKSLALATGIEFTEGQIIVTMDADLQDDPAEIPKLLDRLTQGADLVSGYKIKRRDPISKRLPSRIFNLVTGVVTGLKLSDHNCGLKAGRRDVFENIDLYGEMHRYIGVLAHAMGYRVVEQAVNHRPRQHGKSKFGTERYVRGAVDLLTVLTLTRYGRRPAHLFGGVGAVTGVAGFLILVYLAAVWLLTDVPIGNRPLLLLGVLLVILAVQLASFGLLAELIISRDASSESPSRYVTDEAGRQSTLRSVDTGADSKRYLTERGDL